MGGKIIGSVKRLLIDIATMSHCDQVQLILLRIKLVNHAVVAYPQPKRFQALHPLMGKASEVPAQSVDPLLDPFLNLDWKCKETPIEPMGANLHRRPAGAIHGLRMRTGP